MSTQLYTVTVTDLGSHRITVAADYPAEAENIANGGLFEGMSTLAPEAAIIKREAEAKAEIAEQQPLRMFKITGSFVLEFYLTVPAGSRAEAEGHARRIYEQNCGPFEFEHDGGNLVRLVAEEVLS